ncbi:hypothetical protein GQ44DRAFT_699677 [Phaeosphaeriaceae sp. PMI808]|nr:hypothetical protein GQ44DRAFT_699677 [Phaeosphaeriaceae sp. PMI808]
MAFSADEVKILEDEHVLLPSPSVLGKRKVSARFLTPPASDGSVSSSSSGSTASLSFKYYALDPNRNLEIPLSESSPEAFEFYGFTPQVAQEIHYNYCRRPTDSPFDEDEILPWAYGRAHSFNLSSLSPDEALAHIGIKKSLRDGILDPRFRHIFETQSLLFWVRDSLRINYWTLVGLQTRLKEYVEHVSKKKGTKVKRGSISNVFPSAASSSSQPSATISSASSSGHIPKACTVVQESPPVLDDHVVLYKGKAAHEMVDEFQWIQNNGTLDMNALTSLPNGDFNYNREVWYFTTERETAEGYRKFITRRHPDSETWLIQLQVLKNFLNNLKIQPLWYGADWREYVWHCRNAEEPPSKYDSFWRVGPGNAQVIHGAICSAVSRKVKKIAKDKIHELMTQQEVVMKCGNRNASQVAFMQPNVAKDLGVVVQGKIHIEVFAPAKDAEA